MFYNFQYRCQTANQMSSNNTNITSLEECGYSPGDNVTCYIRAATAIGFGPPTKVTIQVECDCKLTMNRLIVFQSTCLTDCLHTKCGKKQAQAILLINYILINRQGASSVC